MKVAGLAVMGEEKRRSKLTDEQVPLFIWTVELAPSLGLGFIGLNLSAYSLDNNPVGNTFICKNEYEMRVQSILLSLTMVLAFISCGKQKATVSSTDEGPIIQTKFLGVEFGDSPFCIVRIGCNTADTRRYAYSSSGSPVSGSKSGPSSPPVGSIPVERYSSQAGSVLSAPVSKSSML